MNLGRRRVDRIRNSSERSSDSGGLWKTVQWSIAVLILIFYMGFVTPSEAAEGGADPFVSAVSIALQTLVIPLTLFLLAVEWRRMMEGARLAKAPILIALLLLLSTAWSIERHVTLRRSLIFLFTTLFALWIGSCLSRARQLHLYAVVSLISIVGCFLIAIVLPSYGISADTHIGEWKGLFQHKNQLGRNMVLAIALFVGGKPFQARWLRWASAAGALALLGLSRSGTGLMGFLAITAAFFIVKLVRVKHRRTLPLWAAMTPMGIFAAAVLLLFRSQLFALIGKDDSLTGRTLIWAFAMDGIRERPWFGHGYGVFWRQSLVGQVMPHGLAATHAHDGYLDILLDCGLVGLLLFGWMLVIYARKVIGRLLDQSQPLSNFTVFAFVFLCLFVTMNLTESNLFREHTVLWIPFVSIYVAMCRRDALEKSLHNASGSRSSCHDIESSLINARDQAASGLL